MKPNKKRIAIILTIHEIEAIKKLAKSEGLSFSDKVRRIIDEYIHDNVRSNPVSHFISKQS